MQGKNLFKTATLSFFIFSVTISNPVQAQEYDPESNSTIIQHSDGGFTIYTPGSNETSVAVFGPDDKKKEAVSCNSNEKRCKELLENAMDNDGKEIPRNKLLKYTGSDTKLRGYVTKVNAEISKGKTGVFVIGKTGKIKHLTPSEAKKWLLAVKNKKTK